jgi:hypothetical protein
MKQARFMLGVGVVLCLAFALVWTQEVFSWWNTSKVKAAPLLSTATGHATWYSLCNGSNGACADFGYPCDSNKMHAAWPHLPQTECYLYCSYVGPVSCGDQVWVTDECPGGYIGSVEIRDCCTCNGPGGCDGLSQCDSHIWSRGDVIIDLTPYAFLCIHGNLGDGRFPAKVYY